MIRCIAIDDEPLALEQISRFIGRIPDLQLVDTCLTVEKAREVLENNSVDLIFLDIEMPGTNGVTFAKWLKDTGMKASVIFITAYSQYAVDGFRLDAVDYLLKPLSFEELQESVEKVKRRLVFPSTPQTAPEADTIFLKVAGEVRKINIADIVYVQGLSAYIQLCMIGEPHLLTTHESLKHFETFLAPDKFFRIHKSFIINIDYLQGATPTTVTVGGKTLPIGKKHRAAFKQYLKTRTLK